MPTLPDSRIERLLEPFLSGPEPDLPSDYELPAGTAVPIQPLSSLIPLLSTYLDLLLRWNARTNLTSIRDPEEIVTRHFGESLYAGLLLARLVGSGAAVLDFGSGAGFPGIPIKLLLPTLQMTLAESQGKKAAFLREAQRLLALSEQGSSEVWDRRVEDMPANRTFTAVTLRAVDNMESALAAARTRVTPGGFLVALTGEPTGLRFLLPQSSNRYVDIHRL